MHECKLNYCKVFVFYKYFCFVNISLAGLDVYIPQWLNAFCHMWLTTNTIMKPFKCLCLEHRNPLALMYTIIPQGYNYIALKFYVLFVKQMEFQLMKINQQTLAKQLPWQTLMVYHWKMFRIQMDNHQKKTLIKKKVINFKFVFLFTSVVVHVVYLKKEQNSGIHLCA